MKGPAGSLQLMWLKINNAPRNQIIYEKMSTLALIKYVRSETSDVNMIIEKYHVMNMCKLTPPNSARLSSVEGANSSRARAYL